MNTEKLTMNPDTIELNDLSEELQTLMKRALVGEKVVLTIEGFELARVILEPTPDNPNRPRIKDLHPNAFEMSDDFDDPLPEEFWTGTKS